MAADCSDPPVVQLCWSKRRRPVSPNSRQSTRLSRGAAWWNWPFGTSSRHVEDPSLEDRTSAGTGYSTAFPGGGLLLLSKRNPSTVSTRTLPDRAPAHASEHCVGVGRWPGGLAGVGEEDTGGLGGGDGDWAVALGRRTVRKAIGLVPRPEERCSQVRATQRRMVAASSGSKSVGVQARAAAGLGAGRRGGRRAGGGGGGRGGEGSKGAGRSRVRRVIVIPPGPLCGGSAAGS